jgi:IS5 family transposase
MEQWKILVLGVVRLGLDADYDRLQELANQHKTLRQMLGHADWYDQQTYELQTLKDNLRLFTPEILGRINVAVVRAGHTLVKKSPEEVLKGRCDSFVVETDVHFPTDINLLHDAIRKTIECSAQISDKLSLKGWRQSKYNLRQFKKLYRKIQQLKRSRPRTKAFARPRNKRFERPTKTTLQRLPFICNGRARRGSKCSPHRLLAL